MCMTSCTKTCFKKLKSVLLLGTCLGLESITESNARRAATTQAMIFLNKDPLWRAWMLTRPWMQILNASMPLVSLARPSISRMHNPKNFHSGSKAAQSQLQNGYTTSTVGIHKNLQKFTVFLYTWKTFLCSIWCQRNLWRQSSWIVQRRATFDVPKYTVLVYLRASGIVGILTIEDFPWQDIASHNHICNRYETQLRLNRVDEQDLFLLDGPDLVLLEEQDLVPPAEQGLVLLEEQDPVFLAGPDLALLKEQDHVFLGDQDLVLLEEQVPCVLEDQVLARLKDEMSFF